MPPKSIKKEEKKALWLDCDKCEFKISSRQVKSKEECSGYGINKNSFFTKKILNDFPNEIILSDIPSMYMERYLLVPESICNYCSFTMNCYVLIEISENERYVKKILTISDKFIDSIYSNSKELAIVQENYSSIKIKKFLENPKIAQKITIKCSENIQYTNEVKRLIKSKLKDTIIHPTNVTIIDFLNKRFKFTMDSIDTKRETADFLDEFSSLTLNDSSLYIVQPETSIEISSNITKESNQVPKISINDVAGLDTIIEELSKIMKLAFNISSKTSRGVLLYGLSGCGKTLLSEAMCSLFEDIKVVRVESFKIFSKFYGESENNLRKIFDEAFEVYPKPCVVLVDEISNICPKNDSSDIIRKVSSLLISILDSLHEKRNGSKIFVIATTNSLDNVDTALRRTGRLDYEIEVPVPNTEIRREILNKMLKNVNLEDWQLENLAKLTHGFVGADLEKLVGKSKNIKNNGVCLTYDDILMNVTSVKPSAMRELMIEKPNVRWTDIGGMHDLKLKLKQIIEWPLQHPEVFKRLGIKPLSGLLMFGPPGCSKTMIAKALATESNLNFISIKGSDLFSMWVGESEKAVRDLFVKARQLAPCIIFFDEIDAIGGERESGSSVKERVLAQILTEIDGVNALKNVIIIGATNRPDLIDKALMRPGRLDRIVYVKLPDDETRREIFSIKLRNIPIDEDVIIDELIERTRGYSGAEIEGVCKEAALKALEESFEIEKISMRFFLKALGALKPRTSPDLLAIYDEYEKTK